MSLQRKLIPGDGRSVRKNFNRLFCGSSLYVKIFCCLSFSEETTASSLFTPTTTATAQASPTTATIVPTSTIAQAASTTTRVTSDLSTTAQTAPITTVVPPSTIAQAARATTTTAQTSTATATTPTTNPYDFSGVSQEVTILSFLSNISWRSCYVIARYFSMRVELFLSPRTVKVWLHGCVVTQLPDAIFYLLN